MASNVGILLPLVISRVFAPNLGGVTPKCSVFLGSGTVPQLGSRYGFPSRAIAASESEWGIKR